MILMMSIFITVVYYTASTWKPLLEVSKDHKNSNDDGRYMYDNGSKVIFIFSNQRSGSTFLGDFFNNNPSIFYLYEPLFPFGFYCDEGVENRMKALGDMSKCDFRQVSKAYREAIQIDGLVVNDRSGCIKKNLCYDDKSQTIINRYASFCNKVSNGELTLEISDYDDFNVWTSEKRTSPRSDTFNCRKSAPYNLTMVSGLCAASTAVVYKILRVCDLSFMEDIFDMLQKKNKEVYVIHLVRDPRAIIPSANAAEHFSRRELAKVTAKLCQRMKRNIEYVEREIPGN